MRRVPRSRGSACPARAAPLLRGVVDDQDGGFELALEAAEEGEDGRDLAGRILVDTVQPDQRVEDEDAGAGPG